jgi:hypothetical protein
MIVAGSLLLVALPLGTNVWSADASQSPDEGLAKLVRDLDAPQFSQRQAASERLSRLGKDAFPALEEAARSKSREVSQRAMEVLKEHYEGEDPATKEAARASLERLAQDASSSVGRRASLALNPPPTEPVFIPNRVPVRVAGRAMQIRIAGAKPAVGGLRIHTRIANGRTETQIEEKGTGRTTKIVQKAAGDIEMEVTETKNGKPVTQKYAAKDAAELKKKHPEAHKIYEKYGQTARIRLQVGNAPPKAPLPADAAKRHAELQAESLDRSLKTLDRQIAALKKTAETNTAAQPLIDRLQQMRQRIVQMKDQATPKEK